MLSAWDLAQLGNKTGATRLGFAVLLKFFQQEGRFPVFKNEIPGAVISFVAPQVGVAPEAYLQYDWQGRIIKDHRAEIRTLLGFRESTVADAEQMKQWLIAEILPQEHQEERLREEAAAWFRHLHLETPTADRFTRVIRSAMHTFEQQFYDETLVRLPATTRAALDALLATETGVAVFQEQNDLSQGNDQPGQELPVTGFPEMFTSVSSHERLPRPVLHRRLLLCLYGLGTNTSFKRLPGADLGTTYADLRYVCSRYIHKEQLRNAIAHVANAIFAVRRAEIWREGTTACASDSKKFGAWNQNLLTEWHIRYRGPGVMIYWHVERKSTCIFSQLKSCSSSEVAAMIEGLLRHCTDAEIEKNYVDTHGHRVM
jgi:hypothetical protein